MFINPIVAMLHNTGTDRYHPILFRESPLPGNPENLVRHRSSGHHTKGFDTRPEALVSAEELAKRQDAKTCLAKDFEWDGRDIPAMVVFFKETPDGIIPMM
jgi:hypothetical protein